MKPLLLAVMIIIASHTAGQKKDTVKVIMLASDTCAGATDYRYGYAIREFHHWYETQKSVAICCDDYWQTVSHLDQFQRPLKLYVWKSDTTNWSWLRTIHSLTSKK